MVVESKYNMPGIKEVSDIYEYFSFVAYMDVGKVR